MSIFTPAKIRSDFDDATISRGSAYAIQKKVIEYKILEKTDRFLKIHGRVRGSSAQIYQVSLSVQLHPFEIESICSCPIGYNCKHAVAILLSMEHQGSEVKPKLLSLNQEPDYWLTQWLQRFTKAGKEKDGKSQKIVFLIRLAKAHDDLCPAVIPLAIKQLKNGTLGKGKYFYPSTELRRAQLNDEQLKAFAILDLHNEHPPHHEEAYILKHSQFDTVLKALFSAGEVFWDSLENPPLTMGPKLRIHFDWVISSNAYQRLMPESLPANIHLLPTTPLYYLNTAENCVGELQHNFPKGSGGLLYNMPPLPPSEAASFFRQFMEKFNKKYPLPKTFDSVSIKNVTPIPCLHIYQDDLVFIERVSQFNHTKALKPCILAKLTFNYDGVEFYSSAKEEYFTRCEGRQLLQYPRDFQTETRSVAWLEDALDLELVSESPDIYLPHMSNTAVINSFFICRTDDLEIYTEFREHGIPKLLTKNWSVTFARDEIFQGLIEPSEWYTELTESGGIDWFGMELGIILDGERIDLLPLLIRALGEVYPDQGNNKKVLLSVPNKGVLEIPKERLERILNVIEGLLVYNPKTKEYEVQVSRQKAALLAEMEKAFQASELRKFGDDRLFQLAQKLSNFKKIQKTEVPKGFLAELRPYQQEGVDWLQFLCEYQLGGILADDMGLGKTIQTLAHITIEKHQGRLNRPSLIIAPTSVIYNWAAEIKKFSPGLDFILWHGDKRAELAEKLTTVNLIITTYPLIVRDAEIFLQHEYYLLILDEAQTIKNTEAKMTQIVQQLKADHRLCLTGTPLENHLGELWSQFNFLMPGILGNKTHFARHYRTAIEKNHDRDIQAQLSRLIKPFMLRRTKQEVIKELPDKTEILQTVELGKEQRDLYETIRLSMNKKIHEAIDKKGLERSQIIILDALLKLRQVCCHPQLLNLDEAKKIRESAKLDTMMQQVVEMVEEGRKILIFSQFTGMLALIEIALVDQKISFVKLTGSTKDRQTPINRFQAGEVPIFLISLKAGGTGLNLTAADTVIHYDPWWNPATENQATDRAHRIGQKQAVFVYKYICKETVEEKILELQEKKKSLMDVIFAGGTHKGSIRKEDLDTLFS